MLPALGLLVLSACGGTSDPPPQQYPAATGSTVTSGAPTSGGSTTGGATMGVTAAGPTTGFMTTAAATTGAPSTTGSITGTTGFSATSGGFSTSTSGGGSTTGAGGVGGNGGNGATTGGTAIEPSFETVKYIIENVQPSCAAADCHGNNEFNNLNLVINEQLYSNLTMTMSEACGNVPVVDPGNPEQSALVMLLKGPCGELERMPRGCIQNEFENNCVPDEYIQAIEQWIADGAPEQ